MNVTFTIRVYDDLQVHLRIESSAGISEIHGDKDTPIIYELLKSLNGSLQRIVSNKDLYLSGTNFSD